MKLRYWKFSEVFSTLKPLMLFHPFVLEKIPERFIFVSILVLEIFPYEAFVYKFQIQLLSKR